jgi:hypothetical protein
MATVTALAGVAVLFIYVAAARKMEAEARSRH